jgi:hypothetical protein
MVTRLLAPHIEVIKNSLSTEENDELVTEMIKFLCPSRLDSVSDNIRDAVNLLDYNFKTPDAKQRAIDYIGSMLYGIRVKKVIVHSNRPGPSRIVKTQTSKSHYKLEDLCQGLIEYRHSYDMAIKYSENLSEKAILMVGKLASEGRFKEAVNYMIENVPPDHPSLNKAKEYLAIENRSYNRWFSIAEDLCKRRLFSESIHLLETFYLQNDEQRASFIDYLNVNYNLSNGEAIR